MATHPIIEQLRDRRLARHLTKNAVAMEAGIHRGFVGTHENKKFSSLSSLERWCNALGYHIVLEDISEAVQRHERETEERATDWHLLIG